MCTTSLEATANNTIQIPWLFSLLVRNLKKRKISQNCALLLFFYARELVEVFVVVDHADETSSRPPIERSSGPLTAPAEAQT